MKQREEVEAKITAKKQERDALLSESEKLNDEINKAYQLFKYLSECKIGADPPAEIINALIETVRVFDMERIEVKFKYRDELE